MIADLARVLAVSHKYATYTLAYVSFEQVPHRVQHIMSNETTPILSAAVPVFELFMTSWEKLVREHPRLKRYVEPGLECAYEYYSRMDDTSVYIVAMCMYVFLLCVDNVLILIHSPQSCYPYVVDQKTLGTKIYRVGRKENS